MFEKQFRVFLVEDDLSDAELLTAAFEKYGDLVALQHMSEGARAMEYIRGFAEQPTDERPHLIILDVSLPDIDGSKLYAQCSFSSSAQGIPMIIFTGGEHMGLEVCAETDDRMIFLKKPDSVDGYDSVSAVMLQHAARYIENRSLKKAS